ncbi:MAG: RecX family transcriptional regulator [Bacilli bacterium]|nr:RecX family transcriptional regulator [Bacilli bacterium]
MKILKYKKNSGNKYKVFLEDGSNIILHENIIIKYNLLISNSLQDDDLKLILEDNNNYLVYDMVLKYISIKMRCESEIRKYLQNKNINKVIIDETINRLKVEGYINEKLYVKSFISDKVRLNKYGPNKIKQELLNLKIDKDIIESELSIYPKDEFIQNLDNLIDKKIKCNRSYGESVLKQKIIIEFSNRGYEKEDIRNILNNKDLSNDELYDKEYKKLYNKYSKKYSDRELEYFVKQKLSQKGFKKMQ